MKKRNFIILGMTLLLLIISGILIVVLNRKDEYRVELKGTEDIVVELKATYEDEGALVYVNDEVSEMAAQLIDSNVNTDVIGTYTVTYGFNDDESLNVVRNVEVKDTTAPTIEFEVDRLMLTQGDPLPKINPKATDNDRVGEMSVEGEVDVETPGIYTLTYTLSDPSGNSTSKKIEVEVLEKPEEVIDEEVSDAPLDLDNEDALANTPKPKPNPKPQPDPNPGQPNPPSDTTAQKPTGACSVGHGTSTPVRSDEYFLSAPKTISNAHNEVICMTFNNKGIAIEGVHDSGIQSIGLMNGSGTVVKTFPQTVNGKVYGSLLKLNDIANGSYTLVSPDQGNLKLVDQRNVDRRIVQGKVGNKLVKVTYPNNHIQLDISNHGYVYDIAINVGHGGDDDGASSGNGQSEAKLNLMVSEYEKQRYKAHGLKVYMSRVDNSTRGEMSGPTQWPLFRRTAHRMGEIATVSRYSYSNHHNSTSNKSKSGWEILVNARANASDLSVEMKVGNGWNEVYGRSMKGPTLYTKHYYTQKIHHKQNGQVYSFIDWYGMQRVPDMLFNEYVPTYEHIYLSNAKDTKWYMDGAWKLMAEAKIKEYVTALGKTYIAP